MMTLADRPYAELEAELQRIRAERDAWRRFALLRGWVRITHRQLSGLKAKIDDVKAELGQLGVDWRADAALQLEIDALIAAEWHEATDRCRASWRPRSPGLWARLKAWWRRVV